MKTRFVTLLLTSPLLAGYVWAIPTPILQYTFNDNDEGSKSYSTGSDTTPVGFLTHNGSFANLRTASGGGVSGLAGDYAFDNTASVSMAGPGGVAISNINNTYIDVDTIDSLKSFTLSGWIKFTDATTLAPEAARIFNANLSGNGIELMMLYQTGDLTHGAQFQFQLNVGGVAAARSGNLAMTLSGGWYFYAVTFDAGSVSYYAGTTTDSVFLVGSASVPTIASGEDSRGFYIGNNNQGANGNRAVDALLDDIRIYGSKTDGAGALSLADLDSVRLSSIPEPSTYAVLTGLAALIGVSAIKRRRI